MNSFQRDEPVSCPRCNRFTGSKQSKYSAFALSSLESVDDQLHHLANRIANLYANVQETDSRRFH